MRLCVSGCACVGLCLDVSGFVSGEGRRLAPGRGRQRAPFPQPLSRTRFPPPSSPFHPLVSPPPALPSTAARTVALHDELRRHVRRRAAAARELGLVGGVADREAEVGRLQGRVVVGREEEEVVGLDVAVDDALSRWGWRLQLGRNQERQREKGERLSLGVCQRRGGGRPRFAQSCTHSPHTAQSTTTHSTQHSPQQHGPEHSPARRTLAWHCAMNRRIERTSPAM